MQENENKSDTFHFADKNNNDKQQTSYQNKYTEGLNCCWIPGLSITGIKWTRYVVV